MTDSNHRPGSDPGTEHLREVLRELAAADAPAVVQRARRRARARAERLIEEALLEDLLGATAAALDAEPREADPPSPAGASAEPHDGDAWWTYCILRAEDAVATASRLEGVEPGTRVSAVCDGEFAALVSPVPLADYGDDRLREHLEDLEWVERIARRHEEVLEGALREASIVPLRLCTLYRDRDGVKRLLRECREALRDGLGRIDGCVEWGVKLFADPQARTVQSPSQPDGAESRGARYLLRRQEERALAEQAAEVRARCVEVVHGRVGALARDVTTNPPQRPEVHGRDLAMLLNGAYLVERARTSELRETVETLREEWTALGFTIELTGPWPPYNFVSGAAGVMS